MRSAQVRDGPPDREIHSFKICFAKLAKKLSKKLFRQRKQRKVLTEKNSKISVANIKNTPFLESIVNLAANGLGFHSCKITVETEHFKPYLKTPNVIH